MATAEKERAVGVPDLKHALIDVPKTKRKLIKGFNKSSEPVYDSDTDCYDSEEYMLYARQKSESECFDVYVEPHGVMSSFCVYNDLSKVAPYQVEECEDFARKAVLYHNLNKEPESSDLEFVKLLNYNMQFVPIKGEMFYLTLEAKDVKDRSVNSYQARFWCAYLYENNKWELIPEVQIFRKRKNTPIIGQDTKLVTKGKSRPCGCGCNGSGPCSS
ncbi:hypothetical protein SLEP1_g15750 [Rubroshorea leprosula]|uniref:Uncharacterized protein n=1 Tax=Rubroshorea leprosula TaxID=152421 RepID=A0AAV5J046_9ROSI|nr:hypothetical protein SLEP1_g15750 [Rubroshorea leprosula]